MNQEKDETEKEFEGLTGPEVRFKFFAEDLQDIKAMADDEFPPFMLIVFHGNGSAHFQMLPSPNVTPHMMGSVATHLRVLSEYNIVAILNQRVAESQRSKILRPGMKIPPDLGHKH